MKKLTPLLILSILFLFSCKKDEIITVPQVEVKTGYFQASPGSYWIYDWFEIDSNGVETQLGILDTIQNIGTTVLNNKTYIERTSSCFAYKTANIFLRDSMGYVVNSSGEILYSYTDFSDTLTTGSIAPLQVIWHKRMFDNVPVNVPVGSFTAIEANQHIYDTINIPYTLCGDPAVELSVMVAPGVGTVIKQSGYFSKLWSCESRLEGRLIDYHIQ